MIKDLLAILAATAIMALFLILMAFLISVTIVIIKCIISALITSFKKKSEEEDYEDLVAADRGEPNV
jgi:hypothetical protein